MAFSLCTLHVCVYVFPFYRDISHIGLGDHSASITWFILTIYIHSDSISIWNHIPRDRELRFPQMNWWGEGHTIQPTTGPEAMMWSAEVSLPGHRAGCWSREHGSGERPRRQNGRFPLAQGQGAFGYLQAWKMRRNCKETEKKELMSWKKNQERDIQRVKKEFQGESDHCVKCS